MSETTIDGGCLCGTIQYELSGASMLNALCHCNNCQKTSGSAFMANGTYKKTQIHVRTGQEHLKTYKDTQTDSENAIVSRSFCGNCGSHLFVENSKLEGMVFVTSGTMNLEGKEWAPQKEYFCKRRRDWIPLVDGTERMDAMK